MKQYAITLILILFSVGAIAQQDASDDVIVNANLTKEHWYDDLDKAKQNPSDVRFLDLSLEKRRTFPDVVFTFNNLKELYAPYNYWRSIPSQIGEMQSLRILDLSGNYYLSKLPDALGKLKNLEKLVLKDHKLAPGEVEAIKKELPNTKVIHQHHRDAD